MQYNSYDKLIRVAYLVFTKYFNSCQRRGYLTLDVVCNCYLAENGTKEFENFITKHVINKNIRFLDLRRR